MTLTGTGGMLAVGVPAERAAELAAGWSDRLWVAIVNGPASTVVAGDGDALDALAAACAEQGVRAHRLAVDYASHTPHVEAVRAQLLRELPDPAPRPTAIAICSSATGGYVDAERLRAGFWCSGLRDPVRFDRAVRACAEGRRPLFVELSPHPALLGHVQDTLRADGSTGLAIGTLRRAEDGPRAFLGSLGQAFAAGVDVDWPALLGPVGVPPPDLPTYAFEHRRYWLEPTAAPAGADLTGAAAAHPAVSAVLPTADEDGVLVTASVSAATLPWVGEHAVGEAVLLPGTALLELVLVAAEPAGCELIEDLTMEQPLRLAEGERRTVQIAVGGPRDDGRRAVSVHSTADGEPGWVRHASGTVGRSGTPPAAAQDWPPDGALDTDITGLYADLRERGYDYGPTFQGVRAMRRAPDGSTWVEAALPETATDAGRHVLHPALLDAALHPLVRSTPAGADDLLLPFSWRGVRVHAAGAAALRVRLQPLGEHRARLTAYDGAGQVVAEVDELSLRPVPRALTGAAELQQLDWVDLDPDRAAGPAERRWGVVDADGSAAPLIAALEDAGARVTVAYDLASLGELTGGGAPPAAVLVPVRAEPDPVSTDLGDEVRRCLAEVLDLVQGWLADPRFAASRLVFVTTGALAASTHAGLVSSAAWGLVRAADAEHPGRFGLVDCVGSDVGSDVAWEAVAAALAAGERELLAHPAGVRVPRLRPAARPAPGAAAPEAPAGTVLVTGGTSGLGALVARRLVEQHGVRRLVLASRRGPDAPEAEALLAMLAEHGATASAVSCDVSDRAAIRALLDGLPAEHPLTAVVHAAGALEDATVERLTSPALDAVLGPKVDAAWALHEATRELPITRFVVFSSVAGVLGTAGQANYAAANAFLDALAAHRQALGQAGTAIAWGLWDVPTVLTGGLDQAALARLARTGIVPLAADEGLALFDQAWRAGAPRLVAARWDRSALTGGAADGPLPPALRGLAPPTGQAAGRATVARSTVVAAPALVAGPTAGTGLVARLAGLAAEDGQRLLGELVRAHVAAVLAEPSPDAVDSRRPFHEMGFDSLTAVELRNRLDRETGLVLSATVAFDHPTVTALAAHLYDALACGAADPAAAGTGATVPEGAPVTVLRAALAALAARMEPADELSRRSVVAVLRHALAGFDAGAEPNRPNQPNQPDQPDELSELTPDEDLFALIDRPT